MDPELLAILRSPVDGQPLRYDGQRLVPEDGGPDFAVVGGIPVLLDAESSAFAGHAQVPTPNGRATVRERVRAKLRRVTTTNPVSSRNYRHLSELLESEPPASKRVLVVGGGILGFGMEPLVAQERLKLVETDIYIGPRTQVVCDAHDLPFADASFDAVVIQAVLEHVLDPVRVVAEIHRVLREDGLLYSEVPFMQQVHEGAYDFTRWTLGGHRRLLRSFAELDSGAVGGPGEALAWSLAYYASAIAGEGAARTSTLAALKLLTLPLRWCDRWLIDRPAAVDAASGTFILARRSTTPRSDQEIVDAYSGAVVTPDR